jgi:hypothetical protein
MNATRGHKAQQVRPSKPERDQLSPKAGSSHLFESGICLRRNKCAVSCIIVPRGQNHTGEKEDAIFIYL